MIPCPNKLITQRLESVLGRLRNTGWVEPQFLRLTNHKIWAWLRKASVRKTSGRLLLGGRCDFLFLLAQETGKGVGVRCEKGGSAFLCGTIRERGVLRRGGGVGHTGVGRVSAGRGGGNNNNIAEIRSPTVILKYLAELQHVMALQNYMKSSKRL